jgi:hypothetical protein
LVEVIVALIIILISFLLAVMVIDGGGKTDDTRALIKAEQCVLQMRDKTLQEKRFIDEEAVYDQINIKKTITDYPGTTGLKVLEIQAYNTDHKLLLSQHEIIVVE